MLTVEGRCGGGIAWQDSFKHIHVSLDTRLPVPYGPAIQSPSTNLQPYPMASDTLTRHQTTCPGLDRNPVVKLVELESSGIAVHIARIRRHPRQGNC